MGMTAAWKARKIAENVTRIIAIEMLAAAQGLDFASPSSSPPIEGVREAIRSKVQRLDEDRSLTEDIEVIERMISEREIVDVAASACDFRRA